MIPLCKYRPDSEWTLDILENARLWLPSLRDFNDPFDGMMPLAFGIRTARFKRRFVDALVADGRSRRAAIEEYKALRDGGYTEDFARMLGGLELSRIVNDFGVLSLSRNTRSVLMWSHYANGHRGICLVFKDPMMSKLAQPVHYANDLPKINYFHSKWGTVRKSAFLWKSDEWRYEQEMRVVFGDRAHTYFEFPRDSLVAVILGCLSKQGDFRTRVCEILRTKYPKAQLYLARKEPDQVGVRFDVHTGR